MTPFDWKNMDYSFLFGNLLKTYDFNTLDESIFYEMDRSHQVLIFLLGSSNNPINVSKKDKER
jgi:hypothetical protein